ncbi:hypothetical protein FACS1894104_2170 [Actinomycetota bacterium]|nr:hypothetical protein FACS1894104_2170 [Actinomycetota bacterium]
MDKFENLIKAGFNHLSQKTGISLKTIKVSLIIIVAALIILGVYFGLFADRGLVLTHADTNSQNQDQSTQTKQLSTEFDKPVEAAPVDDAQIVVYVTGAVNNSGLYTLAASSRIGDAITAAGGMTAEAATEAVNLAEFVNDGAQIHIPSKDEANNLIGGQASPSTAASATSSSTQPQNQGKININTADSSSLQTLDGIGPATAQKILDYRKANGNFKSKEELRNVSGIGEKKYAAIESKITV